MLLLQSARNFANSFTITVLAISLQILAKSQDERLPFSYRNATDIDKQYPNRIVGGHRISIMAAPWQVAVLTDAINLNCGGAIVTQRWLLTAAHCVVRHVVYSVRVGATDRSAEGYLLDIARIIVHRSYDARTMANDIAMLQTKRRIAFAPNVQPVRLPKHGSQQQPQSFRATGWGLLRADAATTPTTLHAAFLNYLPKQDCQRKYAALGISLTPAMFCAVGNGKDTCQGDSGGCITHNDICFGIVSFGIGCADQNYPGVYTNVPTFVQWIQNAIRQLG